MERKKQYVILQVSFELLLQNRFGKITVSKRIKDYIRSFERAVFFVFKREIKQNNICNIYFFIHHEIYMSFGALTSFFVKIEQIIFSII